jgi:hypothetical protein
VITTGSAGRTQGESQQRRHRASAATGPAFRHRQGLVEIGDLDLGIAADQLVSFDERPVADQWLATTVTHRRRRLPRLELVRTTDLRLILGEPLANLAEAGAKLLRRQTVERILIGLRPAKEKYVVHPRHSS